jgi:hypothetical protein
MDSKKKQPRKRLQRVAIAERKPFSKILEDPKENKFAGQEFKNIYSEYKDTKSMTKSDINKIITNALKHSSGDPKTNVLKQALEKVKRKMAKDLKDTSIDKLSVYDFAKILDVDDLGAIANAVGGELYSLYNKPIVKAFVDRQLTNGINKLKSLFRSPADGISSINTKIEAVNVGYIVGALTANFPPESDPSDLPYPVYTNKYTRNYTYTLNINGAGLWIIDPNNIASVSGILTEKWLAFNKDDSFSPQDGTNITWDTALASPLGTSVTLIDNLKPLGIEVVVKPIVSNLNNQGQYILGTLQRDKDRFLPYKTQVTTWDELSSMIGFNTYSLKQDATTRSYPTSLSFSSDPSKNTSSNTDCFGFTILLVDGAAAEASFSISVSVAYSLQPTEIGLVLLRGRVPHMGPYTARFAEFMRIKYPDMCTWDREKMNKYCQRLTQCKPIYEELVKC